MDSRCWGSVSSSISTKRRCSTSAEDISTASLSPIIRYTDITGSVVSLVGTTILLNCTTKFQLCVPSRAYLRPARRKAEFTVDRELSFLKYSSALEAKSWLQLPRDSLRVHQAAHSSIWHSATNKVNVPSFATPASLALACGCGKS
jgi:hypothetical protein